MQEKSYLLYLFIDLAEAAYIVVSGTRYKTNNGGGKNKWAGRNQHIVKERAMTGLIQVNREARREIVRNFLNKTKL